jgi:hypothetical protein
MTTESDSGVSYYLPPRSAIVRHVRIPILDGGKVNVAHTN